MAPPLMNESQRNWMSKTPSERELDRLQKIYGQLKTNNEIVTPIWRTSVRLSCAAPNRVSSPRCSIARVLGNQFSKQNMAAGAAVSTAQNGPDKTPMVLKGRSYGNQRSLQNVQTIQAQRQQQQPSISHISNTPASFGNYYNLKNRLILLDEQRTALMQLYGRDRFLNEYTDLLQQCWHFEQVHKNVLPFAQAKIQAMLAEMKNYAVSNVVKQKRSAVMRPVTPIVKAVDHRNASNISSPKNNTKSPKSCATKPSAKIIPKSTEQSVKLAADSDQPSIGLVKRKTCSNLIGLEETVPTKNCGQNGSILDCPRGTAVGGLMMSNSDDGRLSNYSIDASLHQAPSVFERETNLLSISNNLLFPYLNDLTELERITVENVLSHSIMSEKVDQPEFISTEKQNHETNPTIVALPKSDTRNVEDYQNHQLPDLNDSHCNDIVNTPKLQDENIASAKSQINSNVVGEASEPGMDHANLVPCFGADKHLENPERETSNPPENKNLASAVVDPAMIPVQSNSSKASARSNSFVRSLVEKFSNIY